MKNQGLKIVFGIIIFLFSVALAYFTAWYFQHGSSGSPGYSYRDSSDVFWAVLLLFGGAYILIGIMISRIFPISLGFLFAADVTILHTLNDQYHGLNDGYKALIVGVLLICLYLFAGFKLVDRPTVSANSSQKLNK